MKAFATLLDRLVLTPSRNGKLKLLTDYFRDTPDPDRGYGLAAIAGTLDLKSVKPAMLRELVMERMDEVLFRYSYDYVGDLAETISLVWGNIGGADDAEAQDPRLGEVVTLMNSLGRTEVRGAVRDLLDRLDTSSRFAFLKLATGSLRIGVSARLARQALADFAGKDITEIETLWHGLTPPYTPLFAWLEGKSGRPVLATPAIFIRSCWRRRFPMATSMRWTRPTMPPNGNGTVFACNCPAPAPRENSIPAPATISPPPFPMFWRQSISKA